MSPPIAAEGTIRYSPVSALASSVAHMNTSNDAQQCRCDMQDKAFHADACDRRRQAGGFDLDRPVAQRLRQMRARGVAIGYYTGGQAGVDTRRVVPRGIS
jgi:hypothetical protein